MDKSQTISTKSPEETQAVGAELAASLISSKGRGEGSHSHHIVCLYGELGAGKTVFVQGLAKKLGLAPRLLSPTFIIVRRYDHIREYDFLYHMDLYRIHDQQDLEALGMDEMFADTRSLTVVEWAERLGTSVPKKRIDIRFLSVDETKRRIDITYVG